jgi:hypothetical protein
VLPIKTVKKKWRERCRNTNMVGETMAMGVDLRGLRDLLARVECINPEADLEFFTEKTLFTVTFTKPTFVLVCAM